MVLMYSIVSEERNIFSSFVLKFEKGKLLTQMGQYKADTSSFCSFTQV